MLRIRFDRDDLVRVRFALWPLGETTLSAQALLRDDGESLLGEWRQRARERLTPAARPLLHLVPPQRHQLRTAAITIPDSDHVTLQEELERLEAVSPEAVSLDAVSPQAPREAASPERGPRLTGEVLRAYHAASIAEDWPRLLRPLDVDLAYRARQVLGRGIGGALATLHPTIRWRSPFLEVNVRCYRDSEVDLAGRGLVLVHPAHDPFAFFWGRDTAARPDAAARGALAAVLGRTRAAMLETIAMSGGCGASELARGLGIGLPAVARHLSVLRGAGLLASHRQGRAVLHTLTDLGTQLLRSAGAPAGAPGAQEGPDAAYPPGSGTSALGSRQNVRSAACGAMATTASRCARVMHQTASAASISSGVTARDRCRPASTPSSSSTCPASRVIGSPGRADTPALSTPTPLAGASSAWAIAAAMGERQVLPPQTNSSRRCPTRVAGTPTGRRAASASTMLG